MAHGTTDDVYANTGCRGGADGSVLNGMDYDSFTAIAQREANVDREAAERAIEATLLTRAERLTPAADRKLAAPLPPEVFGWLHTTTDPEHLDVDEFPPPGGRAGGNAGRA